MKKSVFFFYLIYLVSFSYGQETVESLIEQLKTNDEKISKELFEKIINYELAAVQPLKQFAQTNPNNKNLANLLLSQIQRQWEGNGNGIFWKKDFQTAQSEVNDSKKLLLFLHTTGKFSEPYC